MFMTPIKLGLKLKADAILGLYNIRLVWYTTRVM